MSDFIPMVSTTPPPMDGPPDDDFNDFTDYMDGTQDDFSAFSGESDSFDQPIPAFSPVASPVKRPVPSLSNTKQTIDDNIPPMYDGDDDFTDFNDDNWETNINYNHKAENFQATESDDKSENLKNMETLNGDLESSKKNDQTSIIENKVIENNIMNNNIDNNFNEMSVESTNALTEGKSDESKCNDIKDFELNFNKTFEEKTPKNLFKDSDFLQATSVTDDTNSLQSKHNEIKNDVNGTGNESLSISSAIAVNSTSQPQNIDLPSNEKMADKINNFGAFSEMTNEDSDTIKTQNNEIEMAENLKSESVSNDDVELTNNTNFSEDEFGEFSSDKNSDDLEIKISEDTENIKHSFGQENNDVTVTNNIRDDQENIEVNNDPNVVKDSNNGNFSDDEFGHFSSDKNKEINKVEDNTDDNENMPDNNFNNVPEKSSEISDNDKNNLPLECRPSIKDKTEVDNDEDFAAFKDNNDFEAFADFGENNFANFGNTVAEETVSQTNHFNEDKIVTSFPQSKEIDDDDDFGNFSDDDEFGAFDDENNFAAFPSEKPQAPQISPSEVQKDVPVADKIANFVTKYTKESEEVESENPHLLDDWLHTNFFQEKTEVKRDNCNSPGSESVNSMTWAGEVWDHLEDIDNTIALNFLWNGSSHNKHLLKSLGMSLENIMFSGNNKAYYVPSYYAIGLDMMDSSKGILKPMSAAEKITAISPKDKTPPVNVSTDSANEEMIANSNWKSPEGLENNEKIGGPVLDPIAFDVEYLASHSNPEPENKPASSRKADLIDPELLELTTSPSIEVPPVKDPGSAKLTKLLASLKQSSSAPPTSSPTAGSIFTEEEEGSLNQEAKEAIKRLPDLSYMRSKVLMFPINIMSRVKMAD